MHAQYAPLLAVAAISGFVDSIAGGGGLLTLPALLAAGLPPLSALGTNKLQSLFGVTGACFVYARRGQMRLRAMAGPAACAACGAGIGVAAVQRLGSGRLATAMPVLLIGMCLYFAFAPRLDDAGRAPRLGIRAYAAVAVGLGFYDGFFGPGAGAFYAASLVLLLGMGLLPATANTKLLNCASNLASLTLLAAGGHVEWSLGLPMAAANVAGGQLGARMATRLGGRLIRPLLVATCLAMSGKLLLARYGAFRFG